MNAIRPIRKADLPALKAVIDTNDLFPSEMLDDMTCDFLTNANTEDLWWTVEENEMPIAVAYCAPERMTSGTYNLYLIAIHVDYQGQGIGTAIMTHVENHLQENGHRILLVETSALPEFERTRKFYDQVHYERAATIKEFYQAGEDKIIFWKKLSPQP